jgi:DNA ligase (NAD+)
MDIEQVLLAIDELGSRRHTFPFEIDGAVIKVNQRALYSQLGSTAHAPRFARAYKYAPEVAETTLRDITIQVGRTGVLTPVAELEPVQLAGSVISRATLHNAEMIEAKDFRIGDRVLISKHGDVIPAVDAVVIEKRPAEARPYSFPTVCPVCGEPVIKLKDEVAIRCVNPDCPAQRVGRLELFVSRNALDISAIGGRMAEALVQAGLVTRPLDLFDLQPEALAAFKLISEDGTERRFGKKAEDVAQALTQAAQLPLHRWITALGIPGIGETAARTLATLFPSFAEMQQTELIQKIIAFYDTTDRKAEFITDRDLFAGEIIARAEALAPYGVIQRDDPSRNIRDRYLLTVKPELARAFYNFITSNYAEDLFKRLEALGINPVPEVKQAVGTALTGLSFVITGTLSQPREHIEALIRDHGGGVQNAVSKKTSYLITGENPGGSKYNKAQTLGTPMLTESALMAMLATAETPPVPTPPPTPSVTPPPAPKSKKVAAPVEYIQDTLF